jgi:hypothetical protein
MERGRFYIHDGSDWPPPVTCGDTRGLESTTAPHPTYVPRSDDGGQRSWTLSLGSLNRARRTTCWVPTSGSARYLPVTDRKSPRGREFPLRIIARCFPFLRVAAGPGLLQQF